MRPVSLEVVRQRLVDRQHQMSVGGGNSEEEELTMPVMYVNFCDIIDGDRIAAATYGALWMWFDLGPGFYID